MDNLLLLIYLVFLFFEIILLLLYGASYFLTLIFLPFFFLKREKKRKKRKFFEREFLERKFKRELKNNFKSNSKSRRIYFCYWIFILLKTISVCGFIYTLIVLTDWFFKNTDFSVTIISQINDFAVLFLLLLVSGFWRTEILEIRFYSFYRDCFKILKKWKKIKENGEKNKTKVGI